MQVIMLASRLAYEDVSFAIEYVDDTMVRSSSTNIVHFYSQRLKKNED